MIKQITFYNHSYGLSVHKRSGEQLRTWYLCGIAVRQYFDLPKNCGRVTFTAYKRAGVNRIKFELTTLRDATGQEYPRVFIDGQPRYDFQSLTKIEILKLLKKHGTFYVGCEYE